MLKFQVMPIFQLRRDSPIFVEIPKDIRKQRYNHNMTMAMVGTPLYRDVDEA